MKTKTITYNVNNIERKFSGVHRNIDCKALAEIINSPKMQEKVKAGDLIGYYGHWVRTTLGMKPVEGGIVNGRQVTIEPAFKTTLLKAGIDGTITHEAEFLNTTAGRTAYRLYTQKIGGFSSAIIAPVKNGINVPTDFFGFDYVIDPNYNANRGHEVCLDSASHLNAGYEHEYFLLDSAVKDNLIATKVLESLLDSAQVNYELSLQTISSLEQENAELRAMVLNQTAIKSNNQLNHLLDSSSGFVAPVRVSANATNSLIHDIEAFKKLEKGRVEEPDNPNLQASKQAVQNMKNLMGIK